MTLLSKLIWSQTKDGNSGSSKRWGTANFKVFTGEVVSSIFSFGFIALPPIERFVGACLTITVCHIFENLDSHALNNITSNFLRISWFNDASVVFFFNHLLINYILCSINLVFAILIRIQLLSNIHQAFWGGGCGQERGQGDRHELHRSINFKNNKLF